LICGGTGCKLYPLMIERWNAGRDREHWQRIHDEINEPDHIRAARLIAESPPGAGSAPGDPRPCCH
jgi:hypothetical protein